MIISAMALVRAGRRSQLSARAAVFTWHSCLSEAICAMCVHLQVPCSRHRGAGPGRVCSGPELPEHQCTARHARGVVPAVAQDGGQRDFRPLHGAAETGASRRGRSTSAKALSLWSRSLSGSDSGSRWGSRSGSASSTMLPCSPTMMRQPQQSLYEAGLSSDDTLPRLPVSMMELTLDGVEGR